ncbi:TPA: hypothetical protein ACPVYN_002783 [Vibrio parahaemolyticus]|uniref:hypothetical protein n=1 Tax=Vibrio parahaemolyticus TaxID=670 RepID=UPI000403A535|nr:hypothetical protein [Vibrio parahaemolyticus]EGQ7654988.1 hypothetical protein [Vibrio parahaemolyticus]EJM7846928.1 hypothetical protein [Vibrio parahaemolyticus]ELC9530954.1 hypothetical protein [Vibrio parahaemolyticus]TOD61587.1 hypothetical protein CGJ60_18270 [Vibrio parahaemolyticus]HBC3459584.1 hypothetical protein [Vibrio parahaemolyticus]
MEMLSLKECQQAMAALDAADKLNASVENELSQFKNMDTNAIIKRASKMLMTGNLSLEAFGLNPTLFQQIEQLTKLNNKVREKYRGCVQDNIQQLESVEVTADE